MNVGNKPIMMTLLSVPVTWAGTEGFLHGATTVLGFFTSVCGLGIGIYGLLWWRWRFKGRPERDQHQQKERNE